MLLFLNLLVNPMFPVQNCYQALAYGLFLILIIPTVADKTQWGNYGDSSNTLIPLNLNITSAKMLFAIATDITNNGNPQGAYLGYDVIENNKIRFLFDATPWTFAWFCISK